MAEGKQMSLEEELQWAEKQHKLDATLISRLEDENLEFAERIDQMEATIEQLRARIRELENPKARRYEDQSWVDKITLIIGRTRRPMRSREIMRELKAADRAAELSTLADPNKSLSVALSRAVEVGRLKLFKMPGTRGGYYALSRWVDKNGNLSKAMRDEMW